MNHQRRPKASHTMTEERDITAMSRDNCPQPQNLNRNQALKMRLCLLVQSRIMRRGLTDG